jgi:hypothetical protein
LLIVGRQNPGRLDSFRQSRRDRGFSRLSRGGHE